MKHHRDKFEMLYDILLVLRLKPRLKTQLLQKANLSCDSFNLHVENLILDGLVSVDEKRYYSITISGMDKLYKLKELLER